MAFVDSDEFMVIKDPTINNLPDLLKQYVAFGALAVNWQVLAG